MFGIVDRKKELDIVGIDEGFIDFFILIEVSFVEFQQGLGVWVGLGFGRRGIYG